MKLKGLLKKAAAVMMSAAMLCTGAAVLPGFSETGIKVQASEGAFYSARNISVNQSYTDNISSEYEEDYYRFSFSSNSKINISFFT